MDDTERRAQIQGSVDDDRCRHKTVRARYIESPGYSQSIDIVPVNLFERTETLLVIGTSVNQPVFHVIGCIERPCMGYRFKMVCLRIFSITGLRRCVFHIAYRRTVSFLFSTSM